MFTVEYRCHYRPCWYDTGSFDTEKEAIDACVSLHWKSGRDCRVLNEDGAQVYRIPQVASPVTPPKGKRCCG